VVDKKPVRIYIPIASPNGLRREVLMTAVDSLEAVKSIENYHSISKDKDSLQNKFKRIMTQIRVLDNKLKKGYIPEVRSASRLERKIEEKKRVVSKPEPRPKVQPKPRIASSKYDREINELKNLINSI